MPNTPIQQAAIDKRRSEVAYLYCRGWPQHRLAAKFGVSRQAITRDLMVIRAEWRRVMLDSFDKLKSEQLAKIDAVEIEAYRGWRRSLKNAERTRKKAVSDGDSKRSEAETLSEGQAGDPRFLQIIMSCIERRCKLIGADAPQKREHSGPGGSSIPLEVSGALIGQRATANEENIELADAILGRLAGCNHFAAGNGDLHHKGALPSGDPSSPTE